MPHAAPGRALIALAAFVALGANAQAMYKWVDEKGTTHFSESPPPDEKTQKKATKVEPRVIPPGNPGAYDPNAWKAKQAESKRAEVDKGETDRVEAKNDEKKGQACARAKERVAFLSDTPRIYNRNPDGTRTYLDEKERDAEMAKARAAVDQACR